MEATEAFLHPRFAALAAGMAERLEHMTQEVLNRSRRELPDVWAEASYETAVTQFTRESIRAELACLRDHGRIPESLATADVDGTRVTAHLGFPLNDLLWGYRSGHAAQWQAWLDLVESERGLEATERRALLEAGSAFFFAYADRMIALVTETYSAERERVLASREQRRVQLVRELLEGADVDAAALDYDLAGEHLGLVAWGPDAATMLHELAQSCDRRLLLVPAVGEVWWAWLGGARPLTETGRNTLARVTPPAGTGLAMGLPGLGAEGFRSTHEQAQAAYRAALTGAESVVRFEDVALEVLASADVQGARAFVARELEGLDGEDSRAARLRETLFAYFAANHNAAAAAAALGVHQQTVAARLRAVEERIGQPAGARRAELETALRLRRYLAP